MTSQGFPCLVVTLLAWWLRMQARYGVVLRTRGCLLRLGYGEVSSDLLPASGLDRAVIVGRGVCVLRVVPGEPALHPSERLEGLEGLSAPSVVEVVAVGANVEAVRQASEERHLRYVAVDALADGAECAGLVEEANAAFVVDELHPPVWCPRDCGACAAVYFEADRFEVQDELLGSAETSCPGDAWRDIAVDTAVGRGSRLVGDQHRSFLLGMNGGCCGVGHGRSPTLGGVSCTYEMDYKRLLANAHSSSRSICLFVKVLWKMQVHSQQSVSIII